MKRTNRFLEVAAVAGVLVLGVSGLGATASAAVSAAPGCDVAAAYYDTAPNSGNIAMVSNAVHCLIDAERAAAGLPR
ncbi:hypothetical protein [Thermocatellispora tengchongensis]|uniref:hypothetical protein n=1 Tax=Thermocatellispora tengchongensis TaxID=1073253 RepID=UPI00364063AC